MKRKILSFILVAMIVTLVGCGGSSGNYNYYTDDNGNFVYETNRGKDVHVSEIPYEIPYNSKTIIANQ